VGDAPRSGHELLLDTSVYIDLLQGRTPDSVDRLLQLRVNNHSSVCLSELTHLFGRLDPKDRRTAGVLREVRGVIADIPAHRLSAPSVRSSGEAGILAGLVARLGRIEPQHAQATLNDALLYAQASERGMSCSRATSASSTSSIRSGLENASCSTGRLDRPGRLRRPFRPCRATLARWVRKAGSNRSGAPMCSPTRRARPLLNDGAACFRAGSGGIAGVERRRLAS